MAMSPKIRGDFLLEGIAVDDPKRAFAQWVLADGRLRIRGPAEKDVVQKRQVSFLVVRLQGAPISFLASPHFPLRGRPPVFLGKRGSQEHEKYRRERQLAH